MEIVGSTQDQGVLVEVGPTLFTHHEHFTEMEYGTSERMPAVWMRRLMAACPFIMHDV